MLSELYIHSASDRHYFYSHFRSKRPNLRRRFGNVFWQFAPRWQRRSQGCTQKSYHMLLISLSVIGQQILVLRSLDDP
jgi:hypothetical protein